MAKHSNRADTYAGSGTMLLVGNSKIEAVAQGPFAGDNLKTRNIILTKTLTQGLDTKNRTMKRPRSDMVRYIYHQESNAKPKQKTLLKKSTSMKCKESFIPVTKVSSSAPTKSVTPPSHTSVTPRSGEKRTLSARIMALEELAFNDGLVRDGCLLVNRIKELESFVFYASYIPPYNLSSRVEILERQFR